MSTKDEIYIEIAATLQELFGVSAQSLSSTTRLVEDLDLDSIDAIELAVRFEERAGFEFKGPELRAVRSIQDIVDIIYTRQKACAKAPAETPGDALTAGLE